MFGNESETLFQNVSQPALTKTNYFIFFTINTLRFFESFGSGFLIGLFGISLQSTFSHSSIQLTCVSVVLFAPEEFKGKECHGECAHQIRDMNLS